MKRSILFVDDEQPILELYKALFAELDEWEVYLARSGKEALGILAQRPIDVVISDMRMPGMSGAELLTAIMESHPKTVRFIISGHADQEQVARSVGAAHQFLPKPCTGYLHTFDALLSDGRNFFRTHIEPEESAELFISR